jgi:hypothetical protein
MKAHIVNGEKGSGMLEDQYTLFGAQAAAEGPETVIMYPGADAATHKDNEYMKAMREETSMMVESSHKAIRDRYDEIWRHGTLEEKFVSRANMEQSTANIYPPPERSSMLHSYKREIIATPPSSFSVDAHIQRVNADIAILWGLNSTFIQGDSKVYQGVDKNTKTVAPKITKTRGDIARFFSFCYNCIWKKYDIDHLDYVKKAILSTTINPEDIPSEIIGEDRMKMAFEGAKLAGYLAVEIENLKQSTAFSIDYKLPAFTSVSEVIASGAAAVTAGIKQPQQVEAEINEIINAQTGNLE